MTNMIIVDGPDCAPATILLAHGAGAGMDTDFMDAFADGLADHRFRVVRFEFPYTAERRQTGKRRPPDREPILRQTWLDVIATFEAEMLFIGGKSMGGRIASLIADEADVAGLVCLGYPFHPTRKPDQLPVGRNLRNADVMMPGLVDCCRGWLRVAADRIRPVQWMASWLGPTRCWTRTTSGASRSF